jgi:hypothetical protein
MPPDEDFRVANDGTTQFKGPAVWSLMPKPDQRPLLMDYLNKLGEEGWELVSMPVAHIPNRYQYDARVFYRYVAILKRPEQDTP